MTIVQWNCNGFNAHIGELQHLVSYTQPYYICLQETRLHKHQQARLKGYTVYRKDRENDINASGGVAVLVADTRYAQEVNIHSSLEAIAITTYNPIKLTICSVYLPPNKNISQSDLINLLKQLPTPFILTGDFNGHNISWGSTHTDKRGRQIEKLMDENLILLNDNSPTHFCTRTGNFSNIDLTFCHPRLVPNITWKVLTYFQGSNHFPIEIRFPIENTKETCTTYPRWDLKNANWDYFSLLSRINSSISSTDDINSVVENFTSFITNAAKEAIGYKKIREHSKTVPWWNKKCEKAIRDNKTALYKYRKNKTIDNLINLKKTRAIARKTIVQSKKQSWQEYVSTINPNTSTKELWGKIKKIKGIATTTRASTLIAGTSVVTDPQDITNTLADTFESNFSSKNYSQEFNEYKTEIEKEPLNVNLDDNNPLNKPITQAELTAVIKELKNNSSPGPDGIPYEIIKYFPEETLDYLLKIYNHIWENNTYPNKWKESIVVPILKPNTEKSDPYNYRPISLSNCLSKILQKIINKRLRWFLETENIISKSQSGFRSGRTTIDSMIQLESEIQTAFRNKQHLIAIFFDIEKAYDTVWKNYIVQSLQEYGVGGNILHYIINFLSDRKFKVKTNNCLSEVKIQENGVPQGEILSVTLFLIAMNKIVNFIPRMTKVAIFADDLVIFQKGKNITTLKAQLQNTINNLQKWSQSTGFNFSVPKTKAMHFCKLRKPHTDPILKLKGTNITYVNSIKFLGLILDKKLTWLPHLLNLKTECNRKLNIIKALGHQKWGADREILIKIYNTLIRSKMDYACMIYGTAKPTRIKIIDPIQNMALRIATGAYRSSPTNSIHCEAGEPPLSYRRMQITLNYVINLASKPNIPAYHCIFRSLNNQTIMLNRSPIQKSIVHAFNILNLSLPKITTKNEIQTPPWLLHTAKYNTQLSQMQKQETSSSLYLTLFYEFTSKYADHKFIYTDGSKIDNKTGAAIVIEDSVVKYHLPNHASIYTAEAYSVIKALEYIDEQDQDRKFVICIDCLSLIQSMRNQNAANPIITLIQEKLHQLIKEKGKDIIIMWVPSHMKITGNEKADKAAKEAITTPEIKFPIPPSDLKKEIRRKTLEKWDTDWKAVKNNKLRNIKEDIEKWYTGKNRTEQVIITRLRIGHTAYTHKYLMQKLEPEKCNKCNETVTIKHIIINCIKYDKQRQQHNVPDNLKDALANNPNTLRSIVLFLKDIGLFSQM